MDWDTTEACKAKVRHVMKGFSEHGSEFLDSTTPQVTREAMMLILQLISSHKWALGFLDFTQAFHSGDAIQRTIFAEQPREGIPGMVPGQLLQLLKTCYGLTDGPHAWYTHIRKFLVDDLGYTQSLADPCTFYLFSDDHLGNRKLHGILGLATDDMIHGGDEVHMECMRRIQRTYKLGKFQYNHGRFCGKDLVMESDFSIFIHQQGFVQEKVKDIELDKKRKKERYALCNDSEISQLRTLLGSLAWLSKETRPDLSGRVALLQQTLPHPRVKDLVEANLVAAEARKFSNSGIRIMPIEPHKLRVGIISDASWGNSRSQQFLEESSSDIWEETPTTWIRHHKQFRRTLFHPSSTLEGPNIHDLLPERETVINGQSHSDDWTKNSTIRGPIDDLWTGKTIFRKQPNGNKLPHDQVNETFLQLLNSSSQGGTVAIFYDSDLETKDEPQMLTVASWKSSRLKRKTVNTLSAECQSMVLGVGLIHWFRFMMMEALGHNMSNDQWEQQLAAIPYVAITDSKSLYDCLHKLVCTFTQTEDKRTAIDIAILKDDLQKSGGHTRWIEGSNMIADPLTKKMRGDFLRAVCNKGFWTLTHHGNSKLRKEFEILVATFI